MFARVASAGEVPLGVLQKEGPHDSLVSVQRRVRDTTCMSTVGRT